MGRSLFRYATFTVLSVLAAATSVADTRFVVKVGGYGPRTEVRIARPTLKWEIWPADSGAKVRSVSLTLDGKPVAAVYDERARAVTYTPREALESGVHKVYCRITFDNGAAFDQRWETRVAVSPLVSFPSPNALQQKALTTVNAFRGNLKLPAVTCDDRMNLAALQHSLYLATNRTTGHGEEPGRSGFLGKSGAERLEAYGWIGSSWEDVNVGAIDLRESITELFDAPYHRIPFMQPGTFDIGTGFEDSRLTVEFGTSPDSGVVISPSDGQKGVPCAWTNFESPNPLRFHGNAKRTGYPIVCSVFGPELPKLNYVKASLVADGGHEVPCWLNSQDNDAYLTGAAVLFPQSPLKPNTRYIVRFSAQDDNGKPIEASAIFTTGAK